MHINKQDKDYKPRDIEVSSFISDVAFGATSQFIIVSLSDRVSYCVGCPVSYRLIRACADVIFPAWVNNNIFISSAKTGLGKHRLCVSAKIKQIRAGRWSTGLHSPPNPFSPLWRPKPNCNFKPPIQVLNSALVIRAILNLKLLNIKHVTWFIWKRGKIMSLNVEKKVITIYLIFFIKI